jgi:hypothetical protein
VVLAIETTLLVTLVNSWLRDDDSGKNLLLPGTSIIALGGCQGLCTDDLLLGHPRVLCSFSLTNAVAATPDVVGPA